MAAVGCGMFATAAAFTADGYHGLDPNGRDYTVELEEGGRYVVKGAPGDYRVRCFFNQDYGSDQVFQRDFQIQPVTERPTPGRKVVIASFAAPVTGTFDVACVSPPRSYGHAYEGVPNEGHAPVDTIEVYIDPAHPYAAARRWATAAGACLLLTCATPFLARRRTKRSRL
ncbi:hypothetical protein [Actinomadura sp. CNU-125]|uniref:hypothetical protein n=1 Tax=Actinomadura sp. CNU-125 TaxID=1904961 RepID=UPI00117733AC|nr:hypothetical protein [Actinomadura sp. CNU-125]